MEKHKKTNDFSSSRQQDLWSSISASLSSYAESSYFKTVISLVRGNPFYRGWLKILTLFRRFRMLSYIATLVSYVIALLGTGALLLVYISATLLLLIASALLTIVFIALTSFDIKSSNRDMRKILENKEVYIFFSSDPRALSQNSFFFKNALDISRQPNCAVLIVTGALFTRRGRFLSLKKETDSLFIIRKYYYFSFKKHVIPALSGKIISVF